MADLNPSRRRHRTVALCLVVLLCAFVATSVRRVHARQSPTASDGVYTSAQAGRGKTLYQASCAACHGTTLAGDIGPALAGQYFLDVWGAQPLSSLFDKIINTMPADALGTLTRPQVADIVAYTLQANQFPAGPVELSASDAALKQIGLAAPATDSPRPPASNMSFPVVGNLNQVMRGILFPSSNVLFDVQTRDPDDQPAAGAHPEAATTSDRYGGVYTPWMVVDAAAISLAEAGPLLMTPGRRCENGKPVPVDQADWQQYVRGLAEPGRAAYQASQTRNQATVGDVTNQISDACANCHKVYRDTPTAAMRCTPP